MADNGFGKLSMQLTTAMSTSVRMARCHWSRRRCGSWRWGGRYGSPEAAVAAVAWGRRAGVARLPDGREWPAWTGAQIRAAAVDYLQEAGAAVTDAECRRGRRPRMRVRIGDRRGGAAGGFQGRGMTMSKSGILDALKNEEKSLRTQIVAIQRAIEANRRGGCPSRRVGQEEGAQGCRQAEADDDGGTAPSGC